MGATCAFTCEFVVRGDVLPVGFSLHMTTNKVQDFVSKRVNGGPCLFREHRNCFLVLHPLTLVGPGINNVSFNLRRPRVDVAWHKMAHEPHAEQQAQPHLS